MRNLIVLAGLALFFANSSVAQQQKNDSAQLATIQELIAKTQAQLGKRLEDSERLQQELKLAELEIAQTATQLNSTKRDLNTTQKQLNELEQQRSDYQQQIKNQQQALGNQLKSAYMTGDYDFAKMIFNQDEASKFERVLTYYQYLNKARQQQISGFVELVSKLEQVKVQLSQQQQQLSSLLQRQNEQSQRLASQQKRRFDALGKLERAIKSDQTRVANLQKEESDLVAAIERAKLAAQQAQARESVELKGLSALQRKLVMPATGKVQRLFGKRRQGQVRWKGIVIDAKAGAPVVAVADGVVLYSDWLKGFGLVTIVDHGKGYMTVYGRNQALLRKVGDIVVAGETISLVGTSGGQSRASLYFEIRHKGKALNPSSWLVRS